MTETTRRQFILRGLTLGGASFCEEHFCRIKNTFSTAISAGSAKSWNRLSISVSPHLEYFFNGKEALKQDLLSTLGKPISFWSDAKVVTSAELRQKNFSAFSSLGGQPFGLSLEQRLGRGSRNQEEADQFSKGFGFELIYLGSFNNSYGRLCRGDGDFATSLVEASGIQAEMLRASGYRVSSRSGARSHAPAFIAEAYPHFYHLLKSPLKKYDRYLLDAVTRSAESVFLLLPGTEVSKEKAWVCDQMKMAAQELSQKYSQAQWLRETEYLERLGRLIKIERTQLSDSMKLVYSSLMEQRGLRPA
jgi:hypothetical protein